MLVQIYSSSIV